MTLFRFFYQRFHPFYFLILYQMKCLLYLFARYCGKRIMVFHINPPNFIFIQVTLFKEKPYNIYLIDFIFLPFPIYKVTNSGNDGLGVTSGKRNSSGTSVKYSGSISS